MQFPTPRGYGRILRPARQRRVRSDPVCGARFFPFPLALAAATLLLPTPPGTASAPGTLSAQIPGTSPGDTLATAAAQDAYLDETARHLVRGVKASRDTARLGIDAYTALIRERMAVDAPTSRRDQAYVNGERVTRVRWSREEFDVARVLGSRFRDPGQGTNDPYGYFAGLRSERFATDPRADPFLFALGALGAGQDDVSRMILSPLAPDSERHYQFRSGDTTSVELADGRTISAVAVTVIPRVRSIRLLSAMMWIEHEEMALVRVAYRLAKPVNQEISIRLRQGGRWRGGITVDAGLPDAAVRGAADTARAPGAAEPPDSAQAADLAQGSDPAQTSDSSRTDATPRRNTLFDRFLNGVVDNLIPPFELDITTVVADYTLWDFRHWLPRQVLWQGHMAVDEPPGPSGEPAPAVPTTIAWNIEIEDILERGAEPASGMPASAADALEQWRQPDDSITGDADSGDPGETVTITPKDRAALALSELLPPNLWEERPVGLDDEAVAEIASDLAGIGTGGGGDPALAANPWVFHPPGQTLWLLRYNPVEWVSAGTRLRRDFDWGRAVATVRIPTRRFQAPDVQLTLLRDHPAGRLQVSFYRALRGGGIEDGGLGHSPGTFVTSGDSTDFYWSRGVSLRVLPARGERYWMSLRLFAESDADLVGGDEPGPGSDGGSAGGGEAAADPVSGDVRNRFGATAAWRPWWGGLTPRSLGGGGWAHVRATLGDNPHLRAGVTGALTVPLGGDYSVALEAGGARVWGDPAPLDLWSLGGTGIWLRGHSGIVKSSALWRGRIDLQRPVSFLRLSVFADWASTGGDDLYAAGVGVVFMNGITRLDLAQGLPLGRDGRPRAVLRVHVQGDMLF